MRTLLPSTQLCHIMSECTDTCMLCAWYLMQFQSDMLGIPVRVPEAEELSGIGAAYAAGLSLGIYDEKIFDKMNRKSYKSELDREQCEGLYAGWKEAVRMVMTK